MLIKLLCMNKNKIKNNMKTNINKMNKMKIIL